MTDQRQQQQQQHYTEWKQHNQSTTALICHPQKTKLLSSSSLYKRRRVSLITLLFLLFPSSQCLSTNPPQSHNKRGFAAASSSSSSRRKFTNDAATFATTIATTTTATKAAALTNNSNNMPETNDKENIIRWGIVGLGDVTTIKSGPPFWKNDGSKLVAVMRRTPHAAQKWIETNVPTSLQTGITPYDNLDEFLQDEHLDAVYVATPPATHLDVCQQVAKAGKVCYVEKPCGRCGWETEEIIKAFDSKQQQQQQEQLFTAYISRAYKRTDVMKTLLRQGTIGDKVTSITYNLKGMGGARGVEDDTAWRLDARKSGGGLIMDVGCHVIDRIDYLFGPLVDIKSVAKRRQQPSLTTSRKAQLAVTEVEDYVSMTAKIKSCDWTVIDSVGASVNCVWDFCSDDDDDGPLDELVISGPKGSIQMAAMSPSLPISVLDDSGNVVKTFTFEQPEHTAQNLIQLVTDEIRGAKKHDDGTDIRAPSRGENALRTSKVLDAVLSGYYGGREDKFWNRPETWPGRQQ